MDFDLRKTISRRRRVLGGATRGIYHDYVQMQGEENLKRLSLCLLSYLVMDRIKILIIYF